MRICGVGSKFSAGPPIFLLVAKQVGCAKRILTFGVLGGKKRKASSELPIEMPESFTPSNRQRMLDGSLPGQGVNPAKYLRYA